jgi:hypothetical protein
MPIFCQFIPRNDPVPSVLGGCVGSRPGVEECRKSRPHRDSIRDHPARRESLYQVRYMVCLNSYIIVATHSDHQAE